MSNSVFFTIVIVALNAKQHIDATIRSVLCQTCKDFEVIVKDGQSTDGTLDEVAYDPRIRVYCQPDTSIYDAMNQATQYSRGRYIIYMNCGDVFASEHVLQVFWTVLKDEDCAISYGDYDRDGILHKQPERITPFYMYRTPLCHQTLFFNAEMLREKYAYNTQFRILADYDLELRLMADGGKMKHVDAVVCTYLGGGVSESSAGIKRKHKERKRIIFQCYPLTVRIRYEVMRRLTFPALRSKLTSQSSPKCIRRFYQNTVNFVNDKYK